MIDASHRCKSFLNGKEGIVMLKTNQAMVYKAMQCRRSNYLYAVVTMRMP